MSATIIINAITHRAACTDSLGEQDLIAYDGAAPGFFEVLAKKAAADGFILEIDEHGQGPASYRVTGERDYQDLEAAHQFMQSPDADFWAQY